MSSLNRVAQLLKCCSLDEANFLTMGVLLLPSNDLNNLILDGFSQL